MKNELEVKSVKGNENSIATLALRKFLERCRKKTGKSLKHWCVTELGEDRGRIHLHGIFFGENAAELAVEKWKYGYVFVGSFVSERTINYISKYMLKDDLNNREFTGKVLTSAGMGKQYFERGDWKFKVKDLLRKRPFTKISPQCNFSPDLISGSDLDLLSYNDEILS